MSSTKSKIHKLFKVDVAAHGDLTDTKFNPDDSLAVIGLGLSRTGTTSLQLALTKLELGPSHQGVDLFRSPSRTLAFINVDKCLLAQTWKAGDPELTACLRHLMRGYRSSTDNPINSLPDEIYAAYPQAKYILTVRPDGKDGWWRSITAAVGWHSRRDFLRYVFRFLVWPVRFLRLTDDRVQGSIARWELKYGSYGPHVYDEHNAHVKALIPGESLLVYDVTEGWEPLCRFLGREVPEEPFPQLNEAGAMRTVYFGMMAFGACTWLAYAGGAFTIYWAVLNRGRIGELYNVISRTNWADTARKAHFWSDL